MFLLQSLPHCRPAAVRGLAARAGARAVRRAGSGVRGGGPPTPTSRLPRPALPSRAVSAGTADEWAEFLQRVYRLDTGEWLAAAGRSPRLAPVRCARERRGRRRAHDVHRPGRARLARHGRPGPRSAQRRLRARRSDLRTDRADGLRLGARGFLADIEAPSEAMDTPAYEYFGARLLPSVRPHPLGGDLMHASIWRFSGDPDDLLRRYDAMVAEIPGESVHLCMRAREGIVVVDTCPSERSSRRSRHRRFAHCGPHGLPDPECLEDFPVYAAFVDGKRF